MPREYVSLPPLLKNATQMMRTPQRTEVNKRLEVKQKNEWQLAFQIGKAGPDFWREKGGARESKTTWAASPARK